MAAAMTIRELMTPKVVTVPPTATLVDVARAMRDENVTEVLVLEDERVLGMLTDRDLVVLGVAEGLDPSATDASAISGRELVSVGPGADVEEAIGVMRARSVRRIPVLEDGAPVGMLSLGDLAIARNRRSAPVAAGAAVSSSGRARRGRSAAEPNR